MLVKISPKNLYYGQHGVNLFNGKSLFEMYMMYDLGQYILGIDL